MNEHIKGQRLTNRQSLDMLTQDHDIPVIPSLRIKLESTGPVDETWLRGVHGDLEGDSVMVVKMHAGGDIVHGFDVVDEMSGYLDNKKE